MIIDQYKTIFIHIPKNAGTSIRNYFNIAISSIIKYSIKKHDTVYDIKKKIRDSRRLYNRFAIVRNHYDRMISWYSFLKLWNKNNKKNTVNFDLWIKDPIKESCENWLLVHKNFLLKPQHEWIDETVTILKYENLNKELNKFFEKKINLPTVNKTEHEHYLEYYNEESLNIVYNRFKKDFEKFNYNKL